MMTRDEHAELIEEAILAGQSIAAASEWGSGHAAAEWEAEDVRKALLAAYDAMAARIAELEAERDAARAEAMLTRVQWVHDLGSTYTGEGQCPVCRGWQWEEGHREDCALAALLRGER